MISNDAQLRMLTPYQVAALEILGGADSAIVTEGIVSAQTAAVHAATEEGNPAQLKSALEKRQLELTKLARGFDVLTFVKDLPAALVAARKLSVLWHKVADTELAARELAKQGFKALFRSTEAIELDSLAGSAFFAFIADVIVFSESGTLTGSTELPRATPDELRAAGAYINATTGSLNTHESKSAHSSAQLQAVCSSAAAPSQFLNSSAFPVVISARAGGGPLRMASWLENLYCVRVTVAGRTIMVYDALCDASVRHFLAAQGIDALADVPVGKPAKDRFNAQLVGQVRLKTATGSVSLNLVPSNAMLEMTAVVGERIAAKTALRVAQQYRDKVLAQLPDAARDVISDQYPVDAFVPAAERSFNIDKLIKSIKATLKAGRLPGNVDHVLFNSVWQAPELNRLRQGRHLVRVPIVGSNAQNCGGAYMQFAGGKGLYRFPAAPLARSQKTPREERNFYMVDTILAKAIDGAQKARAKHKSLEEKYQIDDKWLPRRMRNAMLHKQVESAVVAYGDILKQIKKGVCLTDEQKELLSAPSNSAVQAYLIHGAQTSPAHLTELAQRGRALLKAADAEAHELFVSTVITHLQEKA